MIDVSKLKAFSRVFIIDYNEKRSISFVRLFQQAFKHFFNFFKEEMEFNERYREQFIAYLKMHPLKISSIYRILQCLDKFFKFLKTTEDINVEVPFFLTKEVEVEFLEHIKSYKKNILSKEVIMNLVSFWHNYCAEDYQADKPFSTAHFEEYKYRNLAMIYLLINTGITVSELISLQYSDFDKLSSTLKINHEKKYKARILKLDQETRNALVYYLRFFPRRSLWMFPSKSDGKHLTNRAVERMFNLTAKKLGITNLSPSSLRNSYISRLRKTGLTYEEINRMVGNTPTYSYVGNYFEEEDKITKDLLIDP